MCHCGILLVYGNKVDGLKNVKLQCYIIFFFFYFDLIVLVCFFGFKNKGQRMVSSFKCWNLRVLDSTACLGFELST